MKRMQIPPHAFSWPLHTKKQASISTSGDSDGWLPPKAGARARSRCIVASANLRNTTGWGGGAVAS